MIARAVAIVAFTVSLFAAPAHAYVRQRTDDGIPVAWRSSCVFIQPDSAGSPDLDSAVVFSTIQTSMTDWRNAVASCGYLALDYVTPAPLEAHYDGKNIIKFRTDSWCHPDDKQSHDICYSPAAAGITSVFFNDTQGDSNEGALLDTDIELNDINFTFQIVDPAAPLSMMPRSGTTVADLENTLVHELGHVQGLDHTCSDANTPSQEIENTGGPPPACSELSMLPADQLAKITTATMFNSATPGETQKRSPEADDIAGICTAYPLNAKPASCKPASLPSGCNIAPGPAYLDWCLVVIVGMFFAVRKGILLASRNRFAGTTAEARREQPSAPALRDASV